MADYFLYVISVSNVLEPIRSGDCGAGLKDEYGSEY
jgi:hypothetical protein